MRFLFLDAKTDTLVKRFSETRRRHPFSSDERTLTEAIELRARAARRRARRSASCSTPATCRPPRCAAGSRTSSPSTRRKLTLLFESFGFKHGVPLDADLVFDVRCLPNPHYEPELAPLTGRDAAGRRVPRDACPRSSGCTRDIYHFVASWLPDYARDNRNYLTVAIGCTGGRHRSVYLVERLARAFAPRYQVLIRHRELGMSPCAQSQRRTVDDAARTVTLAFTGASGMPFGLRLLECLLAARRARVYLLYSPAAQIVAKQECDLTLPDATARGARASSASATARATGSSSSSAREDWMAPVASGSQSRRRDGDLPVQHGHARRDRGRARRQPDRARRRRDAEGAPAARAGAARDAAVGDPPREHDCRLAHAGAVILPPAPGFYTRPQSVDDIVDFVVARVLDQLGVPHALVPRWGEARDGAGPRRRRA